MRHKQSYFLAVVCSPYPIESGMLLRAKDYNHDEPHYIIAPENFRQYLNVENWSPVHVYGFKRPAQKIYDGQWFYNMRDNRVEEKTKELCIFKPEVCFPLAFSTDKDKTPYSLLDSRFKASFAADPQQVVTIQIEKPQMPKRTDDIHLDSVLFNQWLEIKDEWFPKTNDEDNTVIVCEYTSVLCLSLNNSPVDGELGKERILNCTTLAEKYNLELGVTTDIFDAGRRWYTDILERA